MKLGAKDVEKYLWMQAKKSCKAIEFYQKFILIRLSAATPGKGLAGGRIQFKKLTLLDNYCKIKSVLIKHLEPSGVAPKT